MTLETERLILRPVAPDDDEALFAYCSHPEVGPNAGWEPHESLRETQAIMEDVFLYKDHIFAMVLKDTNTLVGTMGLMDDPKRQNPKAKMVGYAIDYNYWGQGLTPEALEAIIDYGFNTLGLTLISAYCYPHNSRSQKVLEKQGFTKEGTLKYCEVLYNGDVLDNHCYILLNPEL